MVGYINTEPDGEIISKTNLFFDDNGNIAGHRFTTPFTGLMSDTPMEINLR